MINPGFIDYSYPNIVLLPIAVRLVAKVACKPFTNRSEASNAELLGLSKE
jgi:hypothetical protein